MEKQRLLAPIAGLRVTEVRRDGDRWLISANGPGRGACPACGTLSTSRHSTYPRSLQDLPLQGMRVTIEWRAARLRCRHHACAQRIFAERLPGVADCHARRTGRVADIVHLLGHGTGGRPAERILQRLGMPVSDDTVLRVVQRRAMQPRPSPSRLRVVGIDDWAWQKGQRYGTIMVDLERRMVVDVLSDRSAASVATWLRDHPLVEVISRDRHGLYAEGARQGAPQARQVADRFHLIQTLREKIEQQLARLGRPVLWQTSAAVEEEATRAGLHGVRREMFAQVRELHQAGKTATSITRELGLSRRRVDKWVKLEALPDRHAMAQTPGTPAYYQDHLTRRWAEGCTVARRLFTEIQRLGYTGCYTHLAQYVASWRRAAGTTEKTPAAIPPAPLPCDPTTGHRISPQVAAALCLKPRPQLTPRQGSAVDALKAAVPDFAIMRRLAMRFRGILRGHDTDWLCYRILAQAC